MQIFSKRIIHAIQNILQTPYTHIKEYKYWNTRREQVEGRNETLIRSGPS